MSWTEVNQAANAVWSTLGHENVMQLNPQLVPFASAGVYSLAMLVYYNPLETMQNQRLGVNALAEKFVSCLQHYFSPRPVHDHVDSAAHFRALESEIADFLFAPEGKVLDDLALLLDKKLVFANDLE